MKTAAAIRALSTLNTSHQIPYHCPLCRAPLLRQAGLYRCVHNHCFDVAKEGYVNLLPVQNKKSKAPGDSALMVQARRAFLQQGYYQSLCDTIVQLAKQAQPKAQYLLDVGCGVGWYTEALAGQFALHEAHGIDISKHAIKAAAKSARRDKTSAFYYAVASAYDLPYPDDCMDMVLSVFSPLKPSEVQRVLKAGGICIIAGTGSMHLRELAEQIYEKVVPHRGNAMDFSSCTEMLEEKHNASVREKIRVKNADIINMLAMTPYYWSTSEEKKHELEKMRNLEVQLDFKLEVITKV